MTPAQVQHIMNKRHYGALPNQGITRLIEGGFIKGVDPSGSSVQPASLDLTLDDRIYELPGIALPGRNEHMNHFRKALGAKEISFDHPLVRGKPYLIRMKEEFALPDCCYGYVNPKSSTGRVDLHARLLTNEGHSFDSMRIGYHGPAWTVVVPKSFDTKLSPGMSLNQMRFFSGDTRFAQSDLDREYELNPLVWNKYLDLPIRLDMVSAPNRNGTVVLHADLTSDIVGWRAKTTDAVLDLSLRDIDPDIFWEPILRPENGQLLLKKDEFWILSTKEGIVVPPWLSAEVVAMDERYMEARTHYAGFFDPGWGWRPDGEMGDTATMEVRSYEDMYLRDGMPLAAFRFEYMTEVPTTLYGINSNYAGQAGAQLAKFFAKK